MKKYYVTFQIVVEAEGETPGAAIESAYCQLPSFYDTTIIGEEPAWGDPSWSKEELDAWQKEAIC